MPRKSSDKTLPVVLVDDEYTVLLSSRLLLEGAGIGEVITLKDSRELMPLLAEREVGLVVLDLFMPYISGTQLLRDVVQTHPELPVIVMTAAQEVETAVDCMKDGAFDYLVKPVEESRFVSSVHRALEMRLLRSQMSALKHSLISGELAHGEAFSPIITVSPRMRSLFQYLEAVANSGEPVLIGGETGTGKELLAEAVHRLSGRAGRFVPVNTSGLDDTLFSDTLFGHRKGAFSGADGKREGMIARAAGGSLFLDEIGDLSLTSQIKLLRLIQSRYYHPLGSDVAQLSDARILCATHHDLTERMTTDAFRPDLYYRLSVHHINVPPLRDRREDIPVLLTHFAEEAAKSLDKALPEPSPELLSLLDNYHFPGNVRELRAMVFDAMARHRTGPVLGVESFRENVKTQVAIGWTQSGGNADRFPSLKEAEQLHIDEALRRAGGNQGTAAALLGISRPALNRRLAKQKGGDQSL